MEKPGARPSPHWSHWRPAPARPWKTLSLSSSRYNDVLFITTTSLVPAAPGTRWRREDISVLNMLWLTPQDHLKRHFQTNTDTFLLMEIKEMLRDGEYSPDVQKVERDFHWNFLPSGHVG